LIWSLAPGVPRATGQGGLLLDGSGSMQGFAVADPQRLQGVLERLHALLSVSSPAATAFVRTDRNGNNERQDLPLKAFGAAVGKPESYHGDTPLRWALTQGREKWDDFVLVTDGMETSGQVDTVIQALSEMAEANWSLGLMAAAVQFRGIYYPEMQVPLQEAVAKAKAAAKAAGTKTWDVTEVPCRGGKSNCYHFRGERPLLFLLVSRSGGLQRLFDAVAGTLRENELDPSRRLQIAPFRVVDLVSEVRPGSPDAERKLELPSSAHGQNEIHCLVQGDQKLPVEVAVRPKTQLDPPQPSRLKQIRRETGPRPPWVADVRNKDGGKATEPRAEVTLVCESLGLLDRVMSPSGRWSPRKGSLDLRFEQEWVTADEGWWVEWNAPNSWQYPFKVYKLAEVVSKVHETARQRQSKAQPPATTVSLKLAVRK